MSRWYVVNTLPNQELRADVNLKRQGFRSWLPATNKIRRHARRVEEVRAPLFPGYLFVKLDLANEPWSTINNTFGVRRLLCRLDDPVALPSEFVEALGASVDPEGSVEGYERALRPGQKVSLLAGPFADCVATLASFATKDRVAVLLEILGRKVTTVVAARIVAPAG